MNPNIARLLGAIFLIFLSQTLTGVLVPLAAVNLHLEAAIVGLLVALPQLVGLFVDIPLAGWSDTVGRRVPVLVGCVAGVVAALLLMGPTPLHLALGSLAFGACLSLTTGPALALVTELVSSDAHARVQGYNGAIQGLSALGGALIAGILATVVGPSPAFWALAIVMAAVALTILFVRERPRAASPRPPGVRQLAGRFVRVFQLFRTQPAIRMASSVSLSYQLQLLTLENAFLPIYLVTGRGYSATTVGILLAARSMIGVLLSAVFGRIFRRYGLVRPIILGNALGLAGAVAVPLVDSPPLLLLLFACQGAGVAFGPATANLLITSATSESERAIGFSANGLVGRISGLALPLLFGFAIQIGGFDLMFVAATVTGVLAIAAMAYIARSLGAWHTTPAMSRSL